jgi:hypothetical protein
MIIFNHITTFVVLLVADEAADKATLGTKHLPDRATAASNEGHWIFKDSDSWGAMCEWWMSAEFRAISEQNQQSKLSVHHYGADCHFCKVQRQVRYNLSPFL